MKVKFANFVVTSADQSHHQLDERIFAELMSKAYERGNNQPVRLLGVGVGIKNQAHAHFQLSILD